MGFEEKSDMICHFTYSGCGLRITYKGKERNQGEWLWASFRNETMIAWTRVIAMEVMSHGQSADILKVESVGFVKRFGVCCEKS